MFRMEDVGGLLEQLETVARARILVGAHGQALAYMMFMEGEPQRKKACVVEIMPQHHMCAFGAWNANNFTMFGGIARLSQVSENVLHCARCLS